MKKQITTWVLICLGIVILALGLTNPSTKSYTEYLRSKGYKLESHVVKIPNLHNEYASDEYECKPFWGKKNSFLILSSYEYQTDSVFIQPEKAIDTKGAVKGGQEMNAEPSAKYYHITKNHIGFLSNFYETKSIVTEFKVN